ncbi:MAG: ABC transporter permease [Algoriphagus sp.]|jgi:lipoprotein-releasing system permease protein|uniref:ABC transporter permease n=1 Tax=Algoriphagus sp. TaxID=1872435 RepID=UPI0027453BB7|nr:ABC transporter permease [Algoriphagus sp.]
MSRVTNLKISRAHLTSRVKQTMVAILSVTFGISMYIFMNGFMSGVNDTQTELAFSTLAHIHIYNDLPEDNTNLLQKKYGEDKLVNLRNAKVIQYTEGIKNSAKIIAALEDHPAITGITPQVNVNVFFRNGATKLNGVLSGIDVKQESVLFGTEQYITQGIWSSMEDRGDGVVLGAGLAEKLSLTLDDNVTVITADGVSRNFKVIGIIKTTIGGVDNAKGYVRISSARQLISKNQSYVTDIQINIKNFNEAAKVAAQLSPKVDYKVETWNESNGQLQAGNDLRNIIAIAVSLTILLVAGFGIFNIMNMTVNEKIKEIAILKAMGFDGTDIIQIFLVQSVIIGVIGGLVGITFGYLVSVLVSYIPFRVATLDTLPMVYDPQDYTLAFIFGLITTFVAGYLPAKKASQVDPVEIIRG